MMPASMPNDQSVVHKRCRKTPETFESKRRSRSLRRPLRAAGEKKNSAVLTLKRTERTSGFTVIRWRYLLRSKPVPWRGTAVMRGGAGIVCQKKENRYREKKYYIHNSKEDGK